MIRYWWVNHKQTHRAEIEDGYVWSPKTKSNGRANETYTNLTKVRVGDVVFSYADAHIRAVGVATGIALTEQKPAAFGAAGDAWADEGWRVPIEWQILRFPLAPKSHLSAIGDLLPTVHSPIRKETGGGNQGVYLAALSFELGQTLQAIIGRTDGEVLEVAAERAADAIADQAERDLSATAHLGPTEIDQIVKARRGQGRFRLNLLKVETRCRLTLVEAEQFLVASHIKPWAASDNAERLDGHNGLLLAPHVDRLFDRGWISFDDDGTLLVADDQSTKALSTWGLPGAGQNAGAFTAGQKRYLAFHRTEVFRRGYLLVNAA